MAAFLEHIGRGARSVEDRPVTQDQIIPILNRLAETMPHGRVPRPKTGAWLPCVLDDPSTWWGASSADNVLAPFGRVGANDIASLFFSSTEIAGGAIMVGLPRSGKSTALHAAIVSMCTLYGPDELQLFLVDAKHGVEFKVYERLPHARMISLHSEREFAVAVLASLAAEIAKRAEIMKAAGINSANLDAYRRQTGQAMPRIVLILDEFHEIFEEDDALGHAAFAAFSDIARQGPFAGIHIVAASQTLSSMPAMDRNTLLLLPGRIAFMSNEFDNELILGDEAREARTLSRQGEGIFNPARGDPAQTRRFRGTYISPEHRGSMLDHFASKSAAEGFSDLPRVFDGTELSRPLDLRVEIAAASTGTRIPLRLGEPFDLRPFFTLTLQRGDGQHIAIVGDVDAAERPDRAVVGVIHAIVADAQRNGADVSVVDFVPDSSAEGDADLAVVCAQVGARFARRRKLGDLLVEFGEAVDERLELEDYRASAKLLILHGVHRAGDLGDTADAVERLLRDGPDVGVHLVVSAPSIASLERRLPAHPGNAFGHWVLGPTASADDVAQIISDPRVTPQRANQVRVHDSARDTTERVRAFAPFPASST
jgi:hypothetical protein